jgi:internalin A
MAITPGTGSTSAPRTAKAFVSYSHKDKDWLDKIRKFIAPRGAFGSEALDLWDDTRIPAGSEWFEEIDQAIRQSAYSILLASQDFLDSEFIWKHEVPKLIEMRAKGHVVFWIPVRPSLTARTVLGKLQAVSDPGKPLSTLSEPEQETALVKIAETIDKFAPEV